MNKLNELFWVLFFLCVDLLFICKYMYIFLKNLFECEVWRLFNKVYYFNVLRVVIVIEYLLKN